MMTEATDFEVLLSIYSDLYKDAFGVRPRDEMDRVSQLTEEEVRAEMSLLEDAVVHDMNYEAEQAADEISHMMDIGAPDVETAKRWLQDVA